MPIGIIVLLVLMVAVTIAYYAISYLKKRKGNTIESRRDLEMARLLLAAVVMVFYLILVICGYWALDGIA